MQHKRTAKPRDRWAARGRLLCSWNDNNGDILPGPAHGNGYSFHHTQTIAQFASLLCPLNARKTIDNVFCNIQMTWSRYPDILRFEPENCLVINTSSSFEQFILSESLNLVRFHRWKLQIVSIVSSFRFLNAFLNNFFWSLRDLFLSITGFMQCTSVTGVEFGLVREKVKWIIYKFRC